MHAPDVIVLGMWLISAAACGSSGGALPGSDSGAAAGDGTCQAGAATLDCGSSTPAPDGGVEPLDAPACPATPPAVGQSCADLKGCAYEATCLLCAPTMRNNPVQCGAAEPYHWASATVAPNPDPCPSSPPQGGTQCGNNLRCDYCADQGLITATCSSIADTFTWSVGIAFSP